MSETNSPGSPAMPDLKGSFSPGVTGVFADGLVVGHNRPDRICVLSWHFVMPDNSRQEVARVMVPQGKLERMIDVLCKSLDYTPKPVQPRKPDGGQ